MTSKLVTPITALLLLLLAPLCVPAVAQEEPATEEESPTQQQPEVRDLTGQEVTSEALIDALAPKEGTAPKTRSGARSLTVSSQPQCDFYRQQRSRGIGIKPVADVVAVSILFAFNKADVTPQAAKTLDAIGEALTSGSLAPCCFELEGHTDSIGSEPYNLGLSQRRAESVANYLAEKFEIDPQRLLTAGRGESQPIASNETDEGRQKNRRVQIVNLGYGEVAQ